MGINQEQTGINQEQTGINQEQTGINQEQTGINQEQTGITEEQMGITEEQTGINLYKGGIFNASQNSTCSKNDILSQRWSTNKLLRAETFMHLLYMYIFVINARWMYIGP